MEAVHEKSFNDMQTIKRRLFATRNGVVADVLRRGGSPFKIIFGVNLPQLDDIAEDTPKSADLATRLWENRTTRESRLIAPMIYPRAEFGIELARKWIDDVECAEVADVLCHKMLRHQQYALELACGILDRGSSSDMQRYTAIRLLFNIVAREPETAWKYAKAECARNCRLTMNVARQLADEAEFIREGTL